MLTTYSSNERDRATELIYGRSAVCCSSSWSVGRPLGERANISLSRRSFTDNLSSRLTLVPMPEISLTNCSYDAGNAAHIGDRDVFQCIDVSSRLGISARGFAELKEHVFFQGIDFDTLYQAPPPLFSLPQQQEVIPTSVNTSLLFTLFIIRSVSSN